MYTNADGLFNKRYELSSALVNSSIHKPDVIAVTEVKPKILTQKLLASEFHMDGYNVFCQGLEENSRRGLLVYIASSVNASVVEVPENFKNTYF